jgi:carbonic anhydrase/acetyltransferase-like protein (isoleucine patch superfamily)
LADGVYVDETALLIGDVVVGENSSIWPCAVVRGDVSHIRIGARTNLQDHCVVHVSHDSRFRPGGQPTDIGDDVTVGHRVTLHGCHIGDRCLIGMGSLLMDGSVVEDDVIVAAGSLVTENMRLHGGQVWMGRPARAVRPLTESEKEYLRYAAQHYVRLKDRYLRAGSE